VAKGRHDVNNLQEKDDPNYGRFPNKISNVYPLSAATQPNEEDQPEVIWIDDLNAADLEDADLNQYELPGAA